MASTAELRLLFAGQAQTQKAVAQVKKDLDSVTGSLKALNSAASLIGVGAGVGALAGMVKAASDVSEAQNKANVVFGESVNIINELAATSSRALGQTRQQVLDTAGGFGLFFLNAGKSREEAANMSATMIRLASDMASFNNQDPSEMLAKLRAGLSGEAEPLKILGVGLTEAAVKAEAMRMGIAKASDELTEAQKVQARYSLILQQTALMQGDLARTSDGLANTQRQVMASLGNSMANLGQIGLTTVEQVGGMAKDVIFWFEDVTAKVPTTVIQLATLVKLGFENLKNGAVLLVLQMAQSVAEKFDFIKRAGAGLAGFLSSLIRAASDLPLIGGFAGDAADALSGLSSGLEDAATGAADFGEKIRVHVAGAQSSANAIVREGQEALGDLANKAKGTGTNIETGYTPPVMKAAGATKKLEESIESLIAKAQALDAAMPAIRNLVAGGDLIAAAQALVDLGKSNAEAVGEVLRIVKELEDEATRAAKEAEAAAKKAMEAEEERLRKIEEGYKAAADAMGQYIIDALRAGREAADGTADYFKNEWVKSIEDRVKQAAREMQDALRAGGDPGPIFAKYKAEFEALKDVQKEQERQAAAAKKAQDDLNAAIDEGKRQSQAWLDNLTEAGKRAFDETAYQESYQRRVFGATITEIKRDVAIAEGIVRNHDAHMEARQRDRERRAANRVTQRGLSRLTAYVAERAGAAVSNDQFADPRLTEVLSGLHGAFLAMLNNGVQVNQRSLASHEAGGPKTSRLLQMSGAAYARG